MTGVQTCALPISQYDWLHLHHEDFTGQYGKFYASFAAAPWYVEQQVMYEKKAKELGFRKVSEMKKAVARKIKEFVGSGGFLFAMCSATDTYDIALASQGVCFTSRGKLDLRRGVYRMQEQPLDPACPCSTCSRFSRSYVSHLVKTKEPVAAQLVSVHNLTFYRRLMARMRTAILAGTFRELYSQEAELLDSDDVDYPPVGPTPAQS